MDRVEDMRQKTDAATADLDPMQHLKKLDYPRRSGTEGEAKAAAYIAGVLKQQGYAPAVTEFIYPKPKLRSRILPPLIVLIWLALSLINVRFWNGNLVVSLIVLLVPSALILAVLNFGRLMRYLSNRRIKRLKNVEEQSKDGTLDPDQVITSRNVIAEIGPADAEQQILFTAHFDSISSRIPTRPMMISMLIGFVGALVYSVLYLVNIIIEGDFIAANLPAYTIFVSILATLLGIAFLSRSLRSNTSHGIIDDGTGVAILLELAKLLKRHPIPGTRFIFGFYGSEESGLVGSTYDYIKREVDKDRLRVISVDMIGEKPPLAYVKKIALIRDAIMDPAFNEQIVSIAEALDIEIEGKIFPYPGSDFAPFMLLGGCTANWIINRSRLIHSKNDHLGNVNEVLVNDAMKLIAAYLLQI
jgi:lipid-A-disaccharide synthase-like uncharacterized protein